MNGKNRFRRLTEERRKLAEQRGSGDMIVSIAADMVKHAKRLGSAAEMGKDSGVREALSKLGTAFRKLGIEIGNTSFKQESERLRRNAERLKGV